MQGRKTGGVRFSGMDGGSGGEMEEVLKDGFKMGRLSGCGLMRKRWLCS